MFFCSFFSSLLPSFVNECFQCSIWFGLVIYFKFYFLSDYTSTFHIHITLLALLQIYTNLMTLRININILGISELKWMGMGKFRRPLYLLLWARIPYKKWSRPHNKQKNPNMNYLGATSTMTE